LAAHFSEKCPAKEKLLTSLRLLANCSRARMMFFRSQSKHQARKGLKGWFSMSREMIRLSILSGVFILLAGCGGSSNGGGGCASPASCPCTSCGGNNTTTVTYKFAGPQTTAVATKIGSGAWTPASLESNTLSLSIPDGTTDYSVAYVCPTASEQIIMASTLDGSSFTEYCYGTSGPTGLATLQVNAAAITKGSFITVEGIKGQIFANTWSTGTQSFSGQLASGTSDVAVYSRSILQHAGDQDSARPDDPWRSQWGKSDRLQYERRVCADDSEL
jgi:hypothetical protein